MYLEDLSYIHDKKCVKFAKDAADGIVELLKSRVKRSGLVVDLGCGTGEVLSTLINSGYKGLGIDQSASILEIARKKVPEASFIQGSFFDVGFPKSLAVVSTCMCLNYAIKNDKSNNLKELFKKVYDSLENGGFFIFDLLGLGVIRNDVEYAESEEGAWHLIIQIKKVPEMRLQTEEYTVFRKDGDLFRKSKELHVLHLYPKEEVLQILKEIGFQVETFESLGSYSLHGGKHDHIGYVCHRTFRK